VPPIPRCLSVILLLSSGCLPRDSPKSERARATPASVALDRLITERMAASGLVGLGAAIIVDQQVIWMKGFGYADEARGVPFTPNTIMNVGSIAKTVTGAALMGLVQEGRLSLDEDINRYLPFQVTNPHRPGARITLRDIATHTSGIADRDAIYEATYYPEGTTPEPLGEFLRAYLTPGGGYYAKENFLDVAPGTYREYSNIAAGLAGFIVEQVTGEPLNVHTRKTIFVPLGMARTGWFLGEIDRATADEMLRFRFDSLHPLVNERWEEKNSGIFWTTKYNGSRMGHGGSDPGVQADMLLDRTREVGVVLIANTSGSERVARAYNSVFEALWMYGEGWKAGRVQRGP
jgi:CubicO group peptidase (beta-lactamase class C family)